MSRLISGIPEPFEKTAPWSTFEDHVPGVNFWSFEIQGSHPTDYVGRLNCITLYAVYMCETFNVHGEESAEGELARGERLPMAPHVYNETQVHLTWDGTQLSVKPVPVDNSRLMPYDYDAPGWTEEDTRKWTLTCTPVLDARTVNWLIASGFQGGRTPYLPALRTVSLAHAVLAAVCAADIGKMLEKPLNEPLWVGDLFQRDSFKTEAESFTPAQEETLLTLASTWSGSYEELLKTARKL